MNRILLLSKSVKIHETLFSLPFAYFGCLLANQGKFDFYFIFLVTLALLFVRTFGMASNRYIDYEIDKLNERTQSRPLASGALSKKSIIVVILSSFSLNTNLAPSNLNNSRNGITYKNTDFIDIGVPKDYHFFCDFMFLY